MLWDPTFESWIHFGVSSQPAAVLVDREGQVIQRWRGRIPEGTVLDLVS